MGQSTDASGPDAGKRAGRWVYDAGQGRCKHRWHRDCAGFVDEGGRIIGKCPKSLGKEQAEAALNAGYEYFDRRGSRDYPSRIFAVIDGVVYRAMPTDPGVSYHGFPELPDQLPPDSDLRRAILDLADADGSRKEVERWMRR